jgi:hypothetical protein
VRDLAFVAAAAVIVIAGWALWRIVQNQRPARLPPGRWSAVHHSLPKGGVEVRLECRGEDPIYFDTVQPADPDFDDKLHRAMAEARARAAALNSER